MLLLMLSLTVGMASAQTNLMLNPSFENSPIPPGQVDPLRWGPGTGDYWYREWGPNIYCMRFSTDGTKWLQLLPIPDGYTFLQVLTTPPFPIKLDRGYNGVMSFGGFAGVTGSCQNPIAIKQNTGHVIQADTDYLLEMEIAWRSEWQHHKSVFTTTDRIYWETSDKVIQLYAYDDPCDPCTPTNIVATSRPLSRMANFYVETGWKTASLVWSSSADPCQAGMIGKKLGIRLLNGDAQCGWLCFDDGFLGVPTITASETGGSTVVYESAADGPVSDTYTVYLTTTPNAPVTVSINVDPCNAADVIVAPASLNFTVVNWATPQIVTVTAVNDTAVEGGPAYGLWPEVVRIDHVGISADYYFNGKIATPVIATCYDDEVADLLIVDNPVVVSEQGTTSDTYTVAMRYLTPDACDITVTISADKPEDVTVVPSVLVFDALNYGVPRTVTVTAVDDSDVDGSPETVVLTHLCAAKTGDPCHDYSLPEAVAHGLREDVSVTVLDNDCGSWGFFEGDVDQNCEVNADDLRKMVANWLACTTPNAAGCEDLR